MEGKQRSVVRLEGFGLGGDSGSRCVFDSLTLGRLSRADADDIRRPSLASADIADVTAPRRIVTGLTRGAPSFARVETVERIDTPFVLPSGTQAGGGHEQEEQDAYYQTYGYYRMWGTDRLPVVLPTDGRAPAFDSEPTPEETPLALRRAAACPPPLGMRVAWNRTPPPEDVPPSEIHWHDSLDVKFVMAGARGQLLDSGQEHIIRAGDVLIQNGTNHAHERLGDGPTVMGYVVAGALRAGRHPPIANLHPVQRGPVGGHRSGETSHKEPLARWTLPRPEPGTYAGIDQWPTSLADVDHPRRVVLGMDDSGLSRVAREEMVERTDLPRSISAPGGAGDFYPIWGVDHLPVVFPTNGLVPPLCSADTGRDAVQLLADMSSTPPPLGLRVGMLRLRAGLGPGDVVQRPAMDVIFVMRGRVEHELPSGETVTLSAGDCLIDHGVPHSWRVEGQDDAVLGWASFGAASFQTDSTAT